MNTLKDRLLELMDAYGLETQKDLAKFLGVSKGLVTQWFNGDTKLGAKPILAIDEKTNYSARWIAEGEGEKFQQGIQDQDPFPDPIDPSTLIPAKSHIGILEHHDTTNSHDRVTRYEVRLAAGNNGSTAEWIVRENDDDPILFRKGWFKARRFNPDNLRGMYVRGDSMEPYLYDHDTVIIDVTETDIIDGEAYAIVYKKRFYVKELQLMDGGVRIVSRNDKYPPMEALDADWKDERDFQVLGRVVWRGG